MDKANFSDAELKDLLRDPSNRAEYRRALKDQSLGRLEYNAETKKIKWIRATVTKPIRQHGQMRVATAGGRVNIFNLCKCHPNGD